MYYPIPILVRTFKHDKEFICHPWGFIYDVGYWLFRYNKGKFLCIDTRELWLESSLVTWFYLDTWDFAKLI